MDGQARRKGATAFATAFAQSLSEVLTEVSNVKTELNVVDDQSLPSEGGELVQYRIQVEGALRGQCFVEFHEAQVGALVRNSIGQQVDAVTDEHKKFLAKHVLAAVRKVESSSLKAYGAFSCRLESVSGLAFGGMLFVPIAESSAQSRMNLTLYFDTEMLNGLALPFVEDGGKGSRASNTSAHNLDLVMDVELDVSLRFGKRQLSLREVLELGSGSVVELDRLVDEPVELYLDGKLIARGEAVVVDGNYGLRVTEISQPVTSQLLN